MQTTVRLAPVPKITWLLIFALASPSSPGSSQSGRDHTGYPTSGRRPTAPSPSSTARTSRSRTRRPERPAGGFGPGRRRVAQVLPRRYPSGVSHDHIARDPRRGRCRWHTAGRREQRPGGPRIPSPDRRAAASLVARQPALGLRLEGCRSMVDRHRRCRWVTPGAADGRHRGAGSGSVRPRMVARRSVDLVLRRRIGRHGRDQRRPSRRNGRSTAADLTY